MYHQHGRWRNWRILAMVAHHEVRCSCPKLYRAAPFRRRRTPQFPAPMHRFRQQPMPRRYSNNVQNNLDKCRSAAVAAVDVYNRPGPRFRTAHFVVLSVISWTAFFHALFFRAGKKPWYRKPNMKAVRYVKVDGEPKHWDLAHCLLQYYGNKNPPERANLEFLLGLRNKIEHRHLSQFDASLYGECQASLMNLEQLLVEEFGDQYALTDQLAISLQFSRKIPAEKKSAARSLASREAKSVTEYTEKFRGGLPSDILNSMKYSFNVFLVPRLVNRRSAADAAIEFINVDEASREELDRLSKLNVLIKEKQVPIVNLHLLRPKQVVGEVCAKRPQHRFTMQKHTDSWRRLGVRPASGSKNPEKTDSRYCVYDPAHGDYLYTRAWVKRLVGELDKNAQNTSEDSKGNNMDRN